MKKLVMSTSALIGRRPIDGQPVLQPLRARPVAQLADGAAEDPGAGLGPVDLPARAAAERGRRPARGCHGFSVPMPAAARSRAMPRTAEAVAAVRRDADLDHRIVEPGPLRIGHADRRILGQVDDAGVVVAEAHLARGQQHAGAAHAADLADLQRDAGAGDEAAGRRRTRPSCRCARSARRRPRRPVPSPVSTVQTRSRSAFGCCTASTTRAMRNGASAAPRSSTPSSSRPMRVSVSVISLERRVGLEMRLQPGEGELHRSDALVQHASGASGLKP